MNGTNTPSLPDDEVLVRFIVSGRHVRQDRTVKPEAFDPPKSLELSVTRAVDRSQSDIWDRGLVVATQRKKSLVGRAELTARQVRDAQPLDAVKAPIIPEDPWHGHIIDWPPEPQKETKKMLMLQLASVVQYIPVPQ